jgi:hypothetical protein
LQRGAMSCSLLYAEVNNHYIARALVHLRLPQWTTPIICFTRQRARKPRAAACRWTVVVVCRGASTLSWTSLLGSRVAVMAAPDDGGGVGDEGTTNVAEEVAIAAREPKRCWHMILNCGHVTSRSSRSSRQNHVCAWPVR